jgi:hypothetical protein
MGLLGYIAGGALQGLGTGIQQDAIQKRADALEAMRQASANQQYLRQRADAEADHTRNRSEQLQDQDTSYKQKVGLLAIGGDVQAKRDAQQHTYKVDEIKTTQVGQRELATLQNSLAMSKDAADMRLKDQLDSGDIKSVTKGADGQYYGLTDKGLVATGVKAPLNETAEAGGGRLTQSEQANAYDDDRKAWRAGTLKGPEPKKSDYIGMTRQAYYARTGRPNTAAADPPIPAAGGSSVATSPAPAGSNMISMGDYQTAINEAMKKRSAGVTGYAGLSNDQIMAKLHDMAKAAGYTLPPT